MNTPRITDVRPADADHQVVTVEGGDGAHRLTPCGGPESTPERPGCPWRKDAVGRFPADAFKHSASTAYDMAMRQFGCHESGSRRPKTCAGFLLRGADHNLAVRMKGDRIDWERLSDGGHDLHESYVDMAVANGVDPDDPVLRPCR